MSAPEATARARVALAALTTCVLGASALIAIAPADGGASGTGWVRLNSSALERAEPAAAAIGGSIYVVGGFIGPNTTNKAERYDADRDAWSFVAPMPVALNHSSAVPYGGELYVLGGYTGGISNPGVPTGGIADASDAFLRYDSGRDSWSKMPRMPIARAAAAAAVVGDKLYVAGGRNRLPTYTTNEGLVKRLDVFDFASQKWTRGRDMAIAREHAPAHARDPGVYPLEPHALATDDEEKARTSRRRPRPLPHCAGIASVPEAAQSGSAASGREMPAPLGMQGPRAVAAGLPVVLRGGRCVGRSGLLLRRNDGTLAPDDRVPPPGQKRRRCR